MSTDNAGDGLREAVEALANEEDIRASVGTTVTSFVLGYRAAQHRFRLALAEHPATPAEVKRLLNTCTNCGDCFHPSFGPNTEGEPCDRCRDCGCSKVAHNTQPPPAEPDAGYADGLREVLARHRQEHNPALGSSTCACGGWEGPFTMISDDRSYAAHLEAVIADFANMP